MQKDKLAIRLISEIQSHFLSMKKPLTSKMRSLIILRIAKYLAESILENDNVAIDGVRQAIEYVSADCFEKIGHIQTEKISHKNVCERERQAHIVIRYAIIHSKETAAHEDYFHYFSMMETALELLFSNPCQINWREKLLKHVYKTLNFKE